MNKEEDKLPSLSVLIRAQASEAIYLKRYFTNIGMDFTADPSLCCSWCIERADKGDSQAAFVAAVILALGLAGFTDAEKAVTYCEKSAEKLFPPAVLFLASFYESGYGRISPNKSMAMRLMKQAAELDYGPALHAFGVRLLCEGAQKRQEALFYLHRASELDYPPSQFSYAVELLELGGVKETAAAISWLDRAAEQGNAGAHRMLGYFYKGGKHGLPVNAAKAQWHFDAADGIEDGRDVSP